MRVHTRTLTHTLEHTHTHSLRTHSDIAGYNNNSSVSKSTSGLARTFTRIVRNICKNTHTHRHTHMYMYCSRCWCCCYCCCCYCFSCSCFPLANKRRRFSSFFLYWCRYFYWGCKRGRGGEGRREYRVCFCPKCSLNRKSKIAGEKRRQRQWRGICIFHCCVRV